MTPDQQLKQLLGLDGENELVEFKEARTNFDLGKLGKYFSALSNEANLKGKPSAWLVFGVDDDRNVVGTRYRDRGRELQSLKKEIADKVMPRQTFLDIHTVNHPKGRVLLFEISPAPQGIPVAWAGHFYGRDHESLVALSLEELERIRNQNRTADWSAGICHDATLADLDAGAIALAREEYAKKHRKLAGQMDSWNNETFLNKAKVTIKGRITRTAILLLGKSESSHFLNPATATITWILKDRDGIEKDYEHFSCPLLVNADQVYKKIRNLKYRYMAEGSLFPEEVDQYDPFVIREPLNNAIAHQDYELGGKVSVIEFEDGRLCFSNSGSFIPGSVEEVIRSDAPENRYRNRFLAEAMVNLNMIDTIGSGIRKMFVTQKNRFFPLPEYQLDRGMVQVTITGRVLDVSYARKLAELPDLSLDDIILLDRVQKKKPLTSEQVRYLKQQGLVEGRKPNLHISVRVARQSGDKAEYIRNRGFDDQHYKGMICEFIGRFGEARRADIDRLLLDKLPDVLDERQKANKVRNLLQALKNQGDIMVDGKVWRMSKQ